MRIRSVHYIAFIMLLVYCLIGCNSTVFDDLGGCPKVFISSSIDRPLANNFLDIRQISEKSGYLSLMMMICWWANFLTRRQSFRQIILCPPHCGIRGNSRLSHGVAVTWRPMIFQIFGKALLPDRKCKCHCG